MLIITNINVALKTPSRVLLRTYHTNMEHWKGQDFQVPVPWGHIKGKKWGNPNGHPWIALHGWMDNAGSFDRLMPLMELNQNRFYCLDYPGHGHSSSVPWGFSYHYLDCLQYIRRVIDHLKVQFTPGTKSV